MWLVCRGLDGGRNKAKVLGEECKIFCLVEQSGRNRVRVNLKREAWNGS